MSNGASLFQALMQGSKLNNGQEMVMPEGLVQLVVYHKVTIKVGPFKKVTGEEFSSEDVFLNDKSAIDFFPVFVQQLIEAELLPEDIKKHPDDLKCGVRHLKISAVMYDEAGEGIEDD